MNERDTGSKEPDTARGTGCGQGVRDGAPLVACGNVNHAHVLAVGASCRQGADRPAETSTEEFLDLLIEMVREDDHNFDGAYLGDRPSDAAEPPLVVTMADGTQFVLHVERHGRVRRPEDEEL